MLTVLFYIMVLVLCFVSFSIMVIGYFRHQQDWNKKTRDYWYGRVMWAVTGMVLAADALARHQHFHYSAVFIVFAALITLKGNLQKGPWGNSNAD